MAGDALDTNITISENIERLKTAKASIKASIEAKGVSVGTNVTLDNYSQYIDAIETGGGGGSEKFIGLIERTATHIDIPEGTTKIGDYAFYNYTNLQSITIPDSVTNIGSGAFAGCKSLTSITIPDSVTSIGNNAFTFCTGLTSITIPDSVTNIGSSAFSNCIKLQSINIPDSVTSIGNYAFQSCSGLTSITIPDSVTSIGSGAFYNCTGLTSVVIPNSVTSIDEYAFGYCTGLTSVTIGSGVTSIGSSAFSNCSGLTSVTSLRTTAPTVQSSTFGNSTSSYTGRNTYNTGTNVLKVPSGATGYNTSYWSSVLLSSTKCGFHIEYIEEPSTDKTITFTPSEYTYDARYSIDGGDDVYVEEGTTATIVLPDTSTTISFNCLKGSSGGWAINGVEKSTARPWTVNVADLNNGDVITCDISS